MKCDNSHENWYMNAIQICENISVVDYHLLLTYLKVDFNLPFCVPFYVALFGYPVKLPNYIFC